VDKNRFQVDMKIAVRQADNSLKKMFNFFIVYRWDCWVGMAVVFLLFTCFCFLVRYTEVRLKMRRKYAFMDVFWRMVRIQLIRSDEIDFKLSAG
jgi:hypothetical protein